MRKWRLSACKFWHLFDKVCELDNIAVILMNKHVSFSITFIGFNRIVHECFVKIIGIFGWSRMAWSLCSNVTVGIAYYHREILFFYFCIFPYLQQYPYGYQVLIVLGFYIDSSWMPKFAMWQLLRCTAYAEGSTHYDGWYFPLEVICTVRICWLLWLFFLKLWLIWLYLMGVSNILQE